MNTKIVIASLIVSIILAGLFYVIGATIFLPNVIGLFAAAFIGSCLTCFWITKPSSSSYSERKPGKPINGGSKETGSVKWFSSSKGFGFITRDSGDDIFVHFRSIMGKGHRILQENQRVQFTVTEGDKGLQAEEVSPL